MKMEKAELFLDQKKIYSHLIFLLVTLSIGIYSFILDEGVTPLGAIFKRSFITFMYIQVFILLSRVFFNSKITDMTHKNFLRNILSRFFMFYISCFVSAFAIIILYHYIHVLAQGQNISSVVSTFMQNEFPTWFAATTKGLAFGAILFLIFSLVGAIQKSRQLKEENLIFQNETLKNQINPHFLFNSLNTLSSLIRPEPEQAEVFIQKFSGIYRYILDHMNTDKVPLETEFDFVEDYFELHKVRDEEKIVMNINRDTNQQFYIPPVSLQILIENAIKHNMATREKPLKIDVYVEDDHLIVKNNLQRMAYQLASSKIGLKNLKERISLLSESDLIVEETKAEFIVKMPLLT